MKKAAGLSVVELLIAMAMIAIIASQAFGAYDRMILRQGIKSYITEFLAAFQYARSESDRREIPVSLCKSTNGANCNTSGHWLQGYIVFTDSVLTGTAGQLDPGDILLKVHGAGPVQASLTGSNGVANWVSFQPNGSANQPGVWRACPSVGSQAFLPSDIRINAQSGSILTTELTAAACP